jgi:cyclase
VGLVSKDLSERVTIFSGSHPWAGVGVTSTVVSSGKQAFVFDSLYYPKDSLELLRSVKSKGLTPVGLINTHWHWDHTAGNQLFFETKRIVSHSLSPDLMRTMLTWDDFNKDLGDKEKIRTVYPNETVEDKSTLKLGNLEIELLHTPGHTPDSIIGNVRDERTIVAGDTVMELPFLWFGDSQVLKNSLERLKPIVKGAMIVQGHGEVCSAEKLDQDIAYIENARKLVADCVKSGKTLKESSSEISLEKCLPKHARENLPKAYNDVHLDNLNALYKEMNGKTG